VLREGSACWIECKTEEDLEALASRNPNRYSRDVGGKWRCIPGEEHAATVGLAYEVWSAAQVNWVLQRNLQFLEDYLRLALRIPDTANPAVIGAIETEPGISLLNLLERTRGVAEPDEIYMLIASGAIYVDLNVANRRARTSSRLCYNGDCCGLRGCQSRELRGIGVRSIDGRLCESTDVHSEAFLLLAAAANWILPCESPLRYCQATSRGGSAVVQHAGQNIAPLDSAYRSARERYWCRLFGAAPEISKRGNRTSRLPEASQNLLTQFIESDYESLRQKFAVSVMGGV